MQESQPPKTLPSPQSVMLELAEAGPQDRVQQSVLTCQGLLKLSGLSCALCIPALKQMPKSSRHQLDSTTVHVLYDLQKRTQAWR